MLHNLDELCEIAFSVKRKKKGGWQSFAFRNVVSTTVTCNLEQEKNAIFSQNRKRYEVMVSSTRGNLISSPPSVAL